MATMNNLGNITTRCVGCDGALSVYQVMRESAIGKSLHAPGDTPDGTMETYFLCKCQGCGRGGLARFLQTGALPFPMGTSLIEFLPSAVPSLQLPIDVPPGVISEFREGEKCMAAGCDRAAAGMFRSVLDKTLRANGYKVAKGTNLEQQIDAAAADGVITKARSLRAHEDIRVLGNDVLHDEWREIPTEDVEMAHHYCQRILEDFYSDRATVEKQLTAQKRTFVPTATAVGPATPANASQTRVVSRAPQPINPLRP